MTRRKPSVVLAEGRWLWRRLFVFATAWGVWGLMGRAVDRVPAAALPHVIDGLMGLLALIAILYLVAPTAQQLTTLALNLRPGFNLGGRR